MSLRRHSRKALQAATSSIYTNPSSLALSLSSSFQSLTISSTITRPLQQQPRQEQQQSRSLHTTPPKLALRDYFSWGGGSKNKGKPDKKTPAERTLGTDLQSAKARQELSQRLTSTSRLSSSSIFGDELQDDGAATSRGGKPKAHKPTTPLGISLAKEHIARGTDPDPRSRVRWQRKMVVRMVGRDLSVYGRETKLEKIRRTERQLWSKSERLPTSIKKLMMLARQVQGKTVDDAILQMQFSKKGMAGAVRRQLEQARDLAVVERGMGLGKANGEVLPQAVKIQTKDKKWLTVQDPTRMYIDQAWVGRAGLRAIKPEYRARGRINMLKSPATWLNFVLKEEKTRMRQHSEREAKKAKQGPWVHLPDRPVTAQRPYYTW